MVCIRTNQSKCHRAIDIIMTQIGLLRSPIIVNYFGTLSVHAVVLSGYNRLSIGFFVTYMDPSFGFAQTWIPNGGRLSIAIGSFVMIAEEHIR